MPCSGSQPGRVPDRVGKRWELVGLHEEAGCLCSHAGCQQQQQPSGHAEQVTRGNREQAEIEQGANGDATGEPEQAACEHRGRAGAARGDAVQKQHDLGPFAQDRQADDDEQGSREGRRRS